MSTSLTGYGKAPPQEARGQAASYVTNSSPMYYPPTPSYALPTSQYDTPPIPPAYGNTAWTPHYGPHDSYFAERPPFQQPRQTPWSSSLVGQQQQVDSHYQFSPPAQFPPTPAITPTEFVPTRPTDDVKSNLGKRFVAKTLPGRVVRASYQSVTSAVTLPAYLSPWGDNNPVTLPNVRKRDVALSAGTYFGVAGLETLAPGVLDFTGTVIDEVIQFGATQVAEQTVDDSIQHIKPGKPIKIVRTANVKSMEGRIKHKLIGVDATIHFVGEYPVQKWLAYDKGWFCPYLYASGRTPSIPRARDFAIAAVDGPGLQADAEMAPKILSVIAEDASVSTLCDADPTHNINCHRLLVLFLGISPWRTQAWSQARNPGEARLMFHLINGIPALVLPVTAQAPICAWSPLTLHQMHGDEFNAETQCNDIFRFLESIISVRNVGQPMRNAWQVLLMMGLRAIIDSARSTRAVSRDIEKTVDLKRAGIVMFRYH
ncbi:hypothetical protein MMC24_001713 [Lignoscripta atroalba]|nr:hypothetical protein [Lignoscripta atroalba]